MFGFFNGIVATFSIVVDFIVSAFEMIVYIVTQIPKALAFLVTVTAYLPPFLLTFVMLFVSVCVVLNLINKGS